MNREAEQHLTKAEQYLAKGDEFYAKAAEEIVAAKEADSALTYEEISGRFRKSERWVRYLVTSWRQTSAVGKPFKMDWERGSHGTKAEIEEGARKLLSSPGEAKKVITNLDSEGLANLVKALVATPEGRDAIRHEQEQRLINQPGTGPVPEPPYPLLHRIEGDRLSLEARAELMVGHWHDGRHDIDAEEERLVRDSMAQAVVAVEEMITGALRGGGVTSEVS